MTEADKFFEETALIAAEPAVSTQPRELDCSDEEYARLERKALRVMARRAAEQYRRGECIPSDQAMSQLRRIAL